MPYFLKLVGRADDPLPENWPEERPEIMTAIFFGPFPRAIRPGDRLIYHACGGSMRIVAEAEVRGQAERGFPRPKSWSREPVKDYEWRMPVRLHAHCLNDGDAPRTREFYTGTIRRSYVRLTDEQGRAMSEALRKACRR